MEWFLYDIKCFKFVFNFHMWINFQMNRTYFYLFFDFGDYNLFRKLGAPEASLHRNESNDFCRTN